MDRRTILKSAIGAFCAPLVKHLPIEKVLPDKWNSCLIPMIRRTFPELLTKEIIGVQPMSGPVGLAFHINYVYEQSRYQKFKNWLFKKTK